MRSQDSPKHLADVPPESADPISGSAPTPPRIISHANGLGLAELGSIGIVLWRGAVTPENYRRQIEMLESLCERHPGRGAMLCILEDAAPPPSEELRQEFVQALRTITVRMSGVAMVIESTGFVGAVKRSVVAGMAMLLPRSHAEIKVVADVSEAASWMAPRCDGASIAGLCEVVEELRARL